MVPKGENYLQEVDEMVVIPVGKKVRFLITANDVIHSWWMPAFAIKQDAIPGFVNTAWTVVDKPGIYRGKCTELCGKNHGFMPIVVKVVEQEEYDQWVNDKKQAAMRLAELTTKEWSTAELMERGETVYDVNCVACHQTEETYHSWNKDNKTKVRHLWGCTDHFRKSRKILSMHERRYR